MKIKDWIKFFENLGVIGADEKTDVSFISGSGTPWDVQKDSMGLIDFRQDKEKNSFKIRIK